MTTKETTDNPRLPRIEVPAQAVCGILKESAACMPGSFGCHEALHLAYVFGEMVSSYLSGHPSVEANPEWAALAEKASQALFDLYQAIGQEHLSADSTDAKP